MNTTRDHQPIINELIEKILATTSASKADIQKNIKALLEEGFGRMELVTQTELKRHTQALASANKKMHELENKITELEQALIVFEQKEHSAEK